MRKITHFLKHAAIKIGLFLRANWAYLLWGAFHFALATVALYPICQRIEISMQYALLIYAVSIAFAVSPLGELIMRAVERARPVETKRDKEYLFPLFEEVYQEACTKTPSLNKHIKLYITESKEVNAFAVGRKTIMVTRGAIESFDSEELKGVIAHEFGHMASGDSMARVITIIGNGFFSAIVLICRAIVNLIELITALKTKRYVLIYIVHLGTNILFKYSVALFLFFGNVILAFNSRYREYLADKYAYQIGFGEQLKEALYLLNNLEMGGKQKLRQWLKASHPHTTARIAKLEQKLDEE